MARSSLHLALAIAIASVSSPLRADPPPEVFGKYVREYRACGGPGFADRGGRCDLAAEDVLEVSPGIMLGDPSPDSLFVSFSAHFDPGEAHLCGYRGHGTWTRQGIVLNASDAPMRAERANPDCRPMLAFTENGIRISDAGNKCRASLCSGADGIDGLFYRRK